MKATRESDLCKPSMFLGYIKKECEMQYPGIHSHIMLLILLESQNIKKHKAVKQKKKPELELFKMVQRQLSQEL